MIQARLSTVSLNNYLVSELNELNFLLILRLFGFKKNLVLFKLAFTKKIKNGAQTNHYMLI